MILPKELMKCLIRQIFSTPIPFTINALYLDSTIFYKSKFDRQDKVGISINRDYFISKSFI